MRLPRWLVACSLLVVGCAVPPSPSLSPSPSPGVGAATGVIVIAHRGASGYLPEHTLAAYDRAIDQGADFIEPDLVATRDGVLIARHENEIGGTTDVARHPEFAARRTEKTIDGRVVTGWFTEDFTLAEVQTLRATERVPQLRPDNARHDGQYPIPTFAAVLELVTRRNAERAAAAVSRGMPAPEPIGVYPETKHPSYFAELGLPLEGRLIATLAAHGYRGADDPVYIQSFETGNLRRLATLTRIRLIQLVASEGAPWDLTAAGDPRSYADLLTAEGLAEVAGYAYGLGAAKELLLPLLPSGRLGPATPLVAAAHAAGLRVHAWTFRAENFFLPPALRSDGGSAQPSRIGRLDLEITAFVRAGIDGVFTDHPDLAVAARDAAKAP